MHFSHVHHANGSKITKFALVAGLHVALGLLFVHGLSTRSISLASLPEQVLVVLEPERMEPPPVPPEPPRPVERTAPPDIVVPQTEVDVAPPLDPVPLQATTTGPDPTPFPAMPAQPEPQAPPARQAAANPGQVRSAVLADANACALPDYPAGAVRRGETGTTTLALLVGADGRVTSARVQQSSGSRDLDRAALNALSLCRFRPATSNGVPEAGWAQLAYVWTLN